MLKTLPLSKLLTESHIINLSARSRKMAVEEMIDQLVNLGDLAPERRDAAVRSVLLREYQACTGLGNGLALPHAKLNGIKRFISAIGISTDGIDFGAPDGGARLVVLLISQPQSDHAVQHLDLLRFIGEHLGSAKDVKALTTGLSPAEVLEAIRGRENHGAQSAS